MNNAVTQETALALKAAGFPQPEPQPGQFWYSPFSGCLCISCHRTDTGAKSMLAPLVWVDWSHNHEAEGYPAGQKELAFAPAATDILPLLGDGAILKFRTDEHGTLWECNIDEGGGRERLLGYDQDNPHEAAAMAWMKRKAK